MTQARTIAPMADEVEFHPPSIGDFFPEAILFEGTPFEFTRINLVQVIATVLLVLFASTLYLDIVHPVANPFQ